LPNPKGIKTLGMVLKPCEEEARRQSASQGHIPKGIWVVKTIAGGEFFCLFFKKYGERNHKNHNSCFVYLLLALFTNSQQKDR